MRQLDVWKTLPFAARLPNTFYVLFHLSFVWQCFYRSNVAHKLRCSGGLMADGCHCHDSRTVFFSRGSRLFSPSFLFTRLDELLSTDSSFSAYKPEKYSNIIHLHILINWILVIRNFSTSSLSHDLSFHLEFAYSRRTEYKRIENSPSPKVIHTRTGSI